MRGFIISSLFSCLAGVAFAQGTITTIHPSAPQQPTAISGPSGYMAKSNNLSDVSNVATARSNLGLSSSSTIDTTNANNITSGTLSVSRLPYTPANKAGDTFTGAVNFNAGLAFPTNATNTVSLAGGDIGGSGKPRLLFKPATAITPPNNTLVGFGTDATWPFTYTDYQASLVSIIDPYGAGSQFNAMRTSDWIASNANPINMTSLTVHDKTVLAVPVWGAYDALERTAGASATNFFGREMSFHNMGASVSGDPFNVNPSGESVLLRLDSGVDTGTGNAVTAALDILNNGGKFNAGIKFGDGAIDTVSGHVNAIQMAKTQEVVWYGSAATPTGSVSTDTNGALQLTGVAGVNVSIGPLNIASGSSYQINGTTVISLSGSTPQIPGPALTGTPTSTTAAADTNTTQVATTAYVIGQAASATPLINGAAAVGTSTRYARADHVHPTDTTRAPLASPSFTGTVTMGAALKLAKTTAAAVLAITCDSSSEGQLYGVTDANSAVFNAALASGGANHMMAYCDATSWKVR